jgi:hypothetical protein
MKIVILIMTFIVLINSNISVRIKSTSNNTNFIQKEEDFFKSSGDSVAYNYDINDKTMGNSLQTDHSMRTPKIVSKLDKGDYYDDTMTRQGVPIGI